MLLKPDLHAFRQQGASLVELMVALVLSLVLVAGVGQIYMGSKQTYRVQDGQSRLQENARAALDVLGRDIRAAGYLGCRSTVTKPLSTSASAATSALTCPSGYAISQTNPNWCQVPLMAIANNLPLVPGPTPIITGGDDADGLPPRFDHPSPALANPLTTNIVRGTDAITVLFGQPQPCAGLATRSTTSVNPANAYTVFNNTCNWQIAPPSLGTPLIIADCQTAHLFRAATDTSQNINFNGVATAQLALPDVQVPVNTYAANSEILLYRAYSYYIRFNPSGEPALYRYDNIANTSDEMVEGIENMQLEYGIDVDNDGTANQFKSQVAWDEWAAVRSVRVTLTVRSVGEAKDNLADKPNAPRSYNGDPNFVDRRLVRTFTETINLRNSTK